jgi:4-hydroxy-tetrahydrodipicolinate reductase
MKRLIVNGCNGRMGQALAQDAAQQSDFKVVAGVDIFPEAMKHPFPVYGSLPAVTEEADVIVDFSRPEALQGLLSYAMPRNLAVVLCTTGFTADDLLLIGRASSHIPIFRSANMSLGVNLAVDLCRRAAYFLGDACDIEIIEKHHNTKVDAPSGTALMIADEINGAYMNSKSYSFGRHSANRKRSRGEIGIHAVRGGTIVGEHEMLFIMQDEILSVKHDAQSKQVFAAGALRAADFITGRAPGLYSMQDMLTAASAVTAVTTDESQSLISMRGVPAGVGFEKKLFTALWKAEINVDIIAAAAPSGGKTSLAFTLPKLLVSQALPIVRGCCEEAEGCTVAPREDIVKISIEGPGMERQPGVAARFFGALSSAGVEALAVTTSETKVSCCVPFAGRRAAVEALMKEFKL